MGSDSILLNQHQLNAGMTATSQQNGRRSRRLLFLARLGSDLARRGGARSRLGRSEYRGHLTSRHVSLVVI